VMLWAAPGDPIDLLPNGEEVRAVLEAQWHLNDPLPVRIASYFFAAMQGDLGTSVAYRTGAPVTEIIGGPGLRSLTWVLGSLALTLGWGVGLALWSPPRAVRRSVQVLSIAPVFLLALLAVNSLNSLTWQLMGAGWIHRPDWFALPLQASAFRTTLAIVILSIGSGSLTEVAQETSNAVKIIRRSGYIDAAIARGEAVWPHLLRNLVPQLASIAARRVAFFVGGLVILEKVLLLDGLGAILWQAALLRDYDLALGIGLMAATLVLLARFTADSLRLAIDPRLAETG